jgi:restriction endonuclease
MEILEKVRSRLEDLKGKKMDDGKNYFDSVYSPLRLLFDLGVSHHLWIDLQSRWEGLSKDEKELYNTLEHAIMRILSNTEKNMSFKEPKQLASSYFADLYGRPTTIKKKPEVDDPIDNNLSKIHL